MMKENSLLLRIVPCIKCDIECLLIRMFFPINLFYDLTLQKQKKIKNLKLCLYLLLFHFHIFNKLDLVLMPIFLLYHICF